MDDSECVARHSFFMSPDANAAILLQSTAPAPKRKEIKKPESQRSSLVSFVSPFALSRLVTRYLLLDKDRQDTEGGTEAVTVTVCASMDM